MTLVCFSSHGFLLNEIEKIASDFALVDAHLVDGLADDCCPPAVFMTVKFWCASFFFKCSYNNLPTNRKIQINFDGTQVCEFTIVHFLLFVEDFDVYLNQEKRLITTESAD